MLLIMKTTFSENLIKYLNDSITVFTGVVGNCSPTCSVSALSHPLTNGLGAGEKVESLQFWVDHALMLLTRRHEAPQTLTNTHTYINTATPSGSAITVICTWNFFFLPRNKLQLQLPMHIKITVRLNHIWSPNAANNTDPWHVKSVMSLWF